jgi:hypothetical protein
VIDANGQSLTYFYARENDHDASIAKVLTMDEAGRLATNFQELSDLLTEARLAATQGRTCFGAIRTCGRGANKKRDGAPSSRDWAASVSNT